MCGKEYVYKPSDVLRIEKELPEGFVPHRYFVMMRRRRQTEWKIPTHD
jgi:hypothetical protein